MLDQELRLEAPPHLIRHVTAASERDERALGAGLAQEAEVPAPADLLVRDRVAQRGDSIGAGVLLGGGSWGRGDRAAGGLCRGFAPGGVLRRCWARLSSRQRGTGQDRQSTR